MRAFHRTSRGGGERLGIVTDRFRGRRLSRGRRQAGPDGELAVTVHGSIPLFDLAAGLEVESLERACTTAGCFRVRGGPLDPGLTDALLARMTEFFKLADDDPVKRAVHRERNGGANGWTPRLEEPAYEAGTIAWVESFDCVLSRDRLASLPPGMSHGVRPSIWPQIPGFRDVVRAHWDGLIDAASTIYPLVSVLLRQQPDFLAGKASSQALNTMRLLNYPEFPLAEDAVNRGISAHTDFECITFIHQTAPGLEVRSPSGDWQQVPVERGQWTVLLGDMVERWSNGEFRATPHRVPTTRWPRRSIVMFLAADPGVAVQPLDAFVDADHPPRFETVTQDGLITAAMARAEANRLAMRSEVEALRKRISPA